MEGATPIPKMKEEKEKKRELAGEQHTRQCMKMVPNAHFTPILFCVSFRFQLQAQQHVKHLNSSDRESQCKINLFVTEEQLRVRLVHVFGTFCKSDGVLDHHSADMKVITRD